MIYSNFNLWNLIVKIRKNILKSKSKWSLNIVIFLLYRKIQALEEEIDVIKTSLNQAINEANNNNTEVKEAENVITPNIKSKFKI